ncbi:MAG: winged helix-turn-helix transcriptional regulator [Proteobacteria bacterium]|nr:winged helix-turn-helix transcriptional regulator [Pseudomonadota bacterium]
MSCFQSIEEMREKCICLNLRPVTRLMTRRYDEAYASTALRSTQVPILFFLMLNGETQMDALGDEMAMDKSTLSRNFRLLEARGLVSRSDIDGRTVGASITAAGQAALEPVCDIWRDI